MKVADYKELRVYRLAYESAMETYRLTRHWPSEEKHLRDHHDHICRQLRKMMDDAASWCGNDGALREVPPEYCVISDALRAPNAPNAPRS